MTPTQKTLKYLRDLDYHCDIVERWMKMPTHPAGGYRKDFLSIIDIIAFDEHKTIGVQSCGQAFSEHLRKLHESPNTPKWLSHPARELWLIGWRKLKVKRGGKAKRWSPRILEIGLNDFNGQRTHTELSKIDERPSAGN
jgi:hypothetical protein